MQVSHKITLALFTTVIICSTIVGYFTYQSAAKDLEYQLGLRLEHISRTASLLIDPEDHEKIFLGFLEQDEKLTERDHFKRVQKTLMDIKLQNHLKEDVYTLVLPEWQADKMLFMAMSNDKTYVGNGLDMNPIVKEIFATGQAQHSPIYSDSEGDWVSAFAPIKDKDGKTIAVIEVDYHVEGEVAAAKAALIRMIGIPTGVALFMALIIGFILGKTLSKPIRNLKEVALEVSKGNLSVSIENKSTDETGVLARTFNEMVIQLKKNKKELQDYAENLEKKVEERTLHLDQAKKEIETLLNNLGQGFMLIDEKGTILPGCTKATERFFGLNPENKSISEVLKLDKYAKDSTMSWLEILYEGTIDFHSAKDLGPSSFQKLNDQYIELDYRPIFNAKGDKLEKLICISEDKSREKELERRLQEDQEYAAMVKSYVMDKDGFIDFLLTLRSGIKEIQQFYLDAENFNKKNLEGTFRVLHTLKGEAAFYHALSLKDSLHSFESLLADLKEKIITYDKSVMQEKISSSCIKFEDVFANFLEVNESIIGSLDEQAHSEYLKISRGQLREVGQKINNRLGDKAPFVEELVSELILERVSDQFIKYQSVIEALARKEFKLVKLNIESSNIKANIEPYKALFSSFIHLFRNAVDHGIETEDEREEVGKDPQGSINMNFNVQSKDSGEQLEIIITDDGRGIDPDRILTIAKKKGLVSDDQDLTEKEILNLLFLPGFTSKESVTDLSGRGVGLDSIRYEAQKIGGSVEVESQIGQGSTFRLSFPLVKSFSFDKKLDNSFDSNRSSNKAA